MKVDLDEAYDHMEWLFVEHPLEDVGLPSKLITVIMQVLNHGSYKLL